MSFATSADKALNQDWQASAPVLALCEDQLEIVNSFQYLESLITTSEIQEEATTNCESNGSFRKYATLAALS